MMELGLKRKEASPAENRSWGRADPHAWPGCHPLHLLHWGAGTGHVQIIAVLVLCACGKRTVLRKFPDRERVPRAFEAFWEDQGSQLGRPWSGKAAGAFGPPPGSRCPRSEGPSQYLCLVITTCDSGPRTSPVQRPPPRRRGRPGGPAGGTPIIEASPSTSTATRTLQNL